MKSFEKEYRKMLQEELPDLWNRIEEGVAEREKRIFGREDFGRMAQEEGGDSFFGQREPWTMRRKSSWQKYSLLAAACLCMAVAIPVLYGGLAGDGAFEATTSAPKEEPAFSEEAAPAEESGAVDSAKAPALAGTEEAADMAAGDREEGGYLSSAAEEDAPGLADGTVVIDVEINILEMSQMKYHTVCRASVTDGNGVLSAGEELEILMEEGQEEIWAEGETYRVDLIYDSRWEIPFRPFKNGR